MTNSVPLNTMLFFSSTTDTFQRAAQPNDKMTSMALADKIERYTTKHLGIMISWLP